MGILTIFIIHVSLGCIGAMWRGMVVQEQKIDIYEQYIKTITTEIADAYDIMVAVELSEAFASDDEVGVAFAKIKSVVEKLRTEILND